MVELTDVSEGSVDQLLSRMAGAYLTGGEQAMFTHMMLSLKNPKNQSPLQLFDSIARNSGDASFHVGVASISGGKAVFKVGTYQYHTSGNIDSVLFYSIGSQKTNFYAGNQTMTLNSEIYSAMRSTVMRKLGNSAKELVQAVEI
ncbi:hypothetical protein GY45DRAFT_1320244 [Cubamyces sp. BRFM 1775]|nr:hypothetical protein GY45DRAFT_1320244 [Cubamyces sp. BRFM 1775]